MTSTVHQNKKGFTLLEVIISMIILSIAFSSMTIAMVNSRKNLLAARQQRNALEIAESLLEEWKANPNRVVAGSNPSVQSVGHYSFDVTTDVSKQSQATPGGLNYAYYRVSVVVDNPSIRPVTLETFINIPGEP
ncbi:MAG: type II secretion system protein [Kiritimatiellaceae bacterium]|nr:type II secretion system protein [Kiritimatiellaceae bacterium]